MKIFIFIIVFLITYSDTRTGEEKYQEIVQMVLSQNGNHNRDYVILVDFSIPNGKNRMFLFDVKKNKIIKSFLVLNGDGCGVAAGKPKSFSNKPGSNCSSTGLFIIGNRDWSGFGINIKYWLDGKDNTNNNARRRLVVIHSSNYVSSIQIYPFNTISSQGCFTTSNKTLRYLDNFIKKQNNKNIALYAFK